MIAGYQYSAYFDHNSLENLPQITVLN